MDSELQRLRFRIRQLEREVRALRDMSGLARLGAAGRTADVQLDARVQRAGPTDGPASRSGFMDPDVEGAAI